MTELSLLEAAEFALKWIAPCENISKCRPGKQGYECPACDAKSRLTAAIERTKHRNDILARIDSMTLTELISLDRANPPRCKPTDDEPFGRRCYVCQKDCTHLCLSIMVSRDGQYVVPYGKCDIDDKWVDACDNHYDDWTCLMFRSSMVNFKLRNPSIFSQSLKPRKEVTTDVRNLV